MPPKKKTQEDNVMSAILNQLQIMNSEIQGMKSEMQCVKSEIQTLNDKFDAMDNKVKIVDDKIDRVEKDVNIKLDHVVKGFDIKLDYVVKDAHQNKSNITQLNKFINNAGIAKMKIDLDCSKLLMETLQLGLTTTSFRMNMISFQLDTLTHIEAKKRNLSLIETVKPTSDSIEKDVTKNLVFDRGKPNK